AAVGEPARSRSRCEVNDEPRSARDGAWCDSRADPCGDAESDRQAGSRQRPGGGLRAVTAATRQEYSMKRLVCGAIAALVATTTIAAATFTSVFKSPAANEVSFAGKKIAALVISTDESLRVAGEESLSGELTKRGLQGVATYRIAPREELAIADHAKTWFERAGVEGVVAL